jgi:hypothetical protein
VTGPEHYATAEQLPGNAGRMLAEHAGDEGLAELLQRQVVAVSMATTHELLAASSAIGLSAHLDRADIDAWSGIASARIRS